MNNEIFYCEDCKDDVSTYIEDREETFNVRGEDITINSQVRVCEHHHHDIYDEVLDSKNIEMAFEKFRWENDYLNPMEIKETREKYGLSQRGFASLLGVGSASIARYETGAVPTKSHHTLLKNMRDNHGFVKDLYEINANKLKRLDKQRMEERLDHEDAQSIIEETIQLYLKKTQIETDPIYNGYIKFNFDKLMNLIIYFSKNIGMLSKTKLMKLLFYTDFRHFKETGLSVTGLSYKKLPYGPVPNHHFLMLDSLLEKEAIDIVPFDSYEGEYIVPLIELNMDAFDKDELNIIHSVVTDFKYTNAQNISDHSHEEEGYKQAELNDLISYEYAEILK
ncbi:type II TA system antitoxin MqsA family protein [Salinicoccus sp. YB14-2]|uniref:type II TA system antitoxin MqsA family protein n=1 Tax=Salinicoccus sp. YB14-2 TaxID=1572701 RepID=UPI00069228DF|nr:type II TA system antitoxin MqsA family protein [Salinicoccus sp. YB14-2]